MPGTEQTRVTLPPGTRFGRYEVITEIASGGMATVYLGRALGAAGFQRLVAIKCLHPHIANDDEFVASFMDEARLAARIRHPNVVPTLDLENGDDGLFLVMEFVEGDGLLGLLRGAARDRKRMPAPVAIRVLLDVLNGLHAAHELTGTQGEPLRLVHRDISPHNILVGVDGIARITDFGIARAEERIGATREGQVKGKLAYMAPEQTQGGATDRRVDLFAAGAVLWECLAARRLFRGENDGEVLRNLLINPIPRLREVAPEMPEALDEVCAKALSRDPEGRYSSAAQFAAALEDAGGSVGIGSARAVSQWVRETSWSRIEALQQQARAFGTDESATSAVRPVPRRRRPSDPDRTMKRDEPPDLSSEAQPYQSSMKLPAAQVAVPAAFLSEVAVPAPVPTASAAPPPTLLSTSSVALPVAAPPPARSSARGLALGAFLVLLAVASGAGVMVWRAHSAGSEPSGAAVVHASMAPVPAAVQPAPVAPAAPTLEARVAPVGALAPSPAVVQDTAAAQDTAAGTRGAHHVVRRGAHGASEPATTVTAPAQPARPSSAASSEGTAPSAHTAPEPSSGAYNPEAM